MGKLGWSEYEYYCCSPEGFYHACQGYFSKLQDESLAIRNAATIIFRALGGKENMDRIWPLKLDSTGKSEHTAPVMTKELWDKIKIKQAIIDKQIKAEKWI